MFKVMFKINKGKPTLLATVGNTKEVNLTFNKPTTKKKQNVIELRDEEGNIVKIYSTL